ncbi:MAG: MgtC/SapB family protein, partial [Clostridia bacterium]|nr:MgtC/SapB family protein [Clostridia bacterium]
AVIIGGLLGLERGLKNRPAGMRTYMLVCTGACIIMLTNQYIFQTTNTGDPTRLAAQIVSGIGFLGAGTIIVTRRSQIKGLTTAAGLWSSAGIGIALGIGFYEAALVGTVAIFAVMTLLQKLDNKMHRKTKNLEVYIEIDRNLSLSNLMQALRDKEFDVQDVQRESGLEADADGNRAYIMQLKLKKRVHHLEIVDEIRTLDHVVYAEEL